LNKDKGLVGLDPKEKQKIEAEVKKEQAADVDAQLYAGIANGIPNEKDQGGNYDALNANFTQGEMRGSHITNINTQTDIELGGLEDPGGIDPVRDKEYLKNMKNHIKTNQ
jgi:hypothetical protein